MASDRRQSIPRLSQGRIVRLLRAALVATPNRLERRAVAGYRIKLESAISRSPRLLQRQRRRADPERQTGGGANAGCTQDHLRHAVRTRSRGVASRLTRRAPMRGGEAYSIRSTRTASQLPFTRFIKQSTRFFCSTCWWGTCIPRILRRVMCSASATAMTRCLPRLALVRPATSCARLASTSQTAAGG